MDEVSLTFTLTIDCKSALLLTDSDMKHAYTIFTHLSSDVPVPLLMSVKTRHCDVTQKHKQNHMWHCGIKTSCGQSL